MKPSEAHYRCIKCAQEWSTLIEGGTYKVVTLEPYVAIPPAHLHSDSCPKCESLYFEWTNYQLPHGAKHMGNHPN